jgi:hypothetical protein
MDRIHQSNPPDDKTHAIALLKRIATTLERIEQQQDEYFAVDPAARYPFGKPIDRWRRRA